MDNNSCSNCSSLSLQCIELKEEIRVLTQKLDRLLNAVFYKKSDFSCQVNPLLVSTVTQTDNDDAPSSSISTQTEHVKSQSLDSDELMYTHVDINQLSASGSKSSLTPLRDVKSYLNDLSAINESSDNALLDIFINANSSNTNLIPPITPSNNVIPFVMLPYLSLSNHPFSHFELARLEQDIKFEKKLHNRSLCYYGEVGYSYDRVNHFPRSLPNSDNYLHLILSHLSNVLPDIKYNSILLTKYSNGSDCIGFHSDNEPEIEPDSDIVTISLGETRVAKFRGYEVGASLPEQSLKLDHGDVFIMSRDSQNFFQHSIAADNCQGARISITLRQLKPSKESVTHSLIEDHTSATPIHPSPIQQPSTEEKYTLYIGDSMIKGMNCDKMSSTTQKAIVYAYPGVTLGGLISKLKTDQNFISLDPGKVKKVYVLCGANDVDKILQIPFTQNSEFFELSSCTPSDQALNNSKEQINHIVDFLHQWSCLASISFINILPRESFARNHIINALNHHVKNLSLQKTFLQMTSTEFHRNLFTFKDGNRKRIYFSNRGNDNVHLNKIGLVRLARYLKYFAHNLL